MPGARLTGANLLGVKATGAFLSQARMVDADLRGAKFRFSQMIEVDFFGSKMNSSTIFSGARLDGSRWCKGGCHCESPSVGICVGCGSREICTGPQE